MKTAIYRRVSKTQKKEGEVSLREQKRLCQELADELGLEVVATLSDKESGTSRKRKGFTEVCRMVVSGEVDSIVTWKQDRLGRGRGILPLRDTLDELPYHGKRFPIHIVTGVFDHRTMMLMAEVAQMEIDDIAERMEMGWRGRLRDGKMGPGEVLFGYQRSETGFAEVNEDEAAIVRKVFDLYLQGVPWIEIRNELEAQGLHTRSGKPWHTAHLKRLVNQQAYHSGYRLYERKAVFEPETFKVEHPPIIDDETWRLAQDKRIAGRERYRGHNTRAPAILRGMIYCQAHNSALQVRRRRMSYTCKRTDQVPEEAKPDCCGGLKIGKVDWAVWEKVTQMIIDQNDLEERLLAQVAHLSEEYAEIQANVEKYQRRVDRLETERQNVVRAHSQGIITDDDLATRLDEISFNQLDVQKRLASAEARAATAQDPETANDQIREWIEDLRIQIEYGAKLDRRMLSFEIEEPYEDIVVQSVLARYDPDGTYRAEFGDDLESAARAAITDWMRSVVQQVVSRVEVDGQKHIHIEYALGPALKLAGIPVLV